MNFDRVARYYDRLAFLVFGQSMINAQVIHFQKIKKSSRILIIGGGTGWILEHLPAYCSFVTYVEPSNKMLEFARNRDVNFPVEFIQAPLEKVELLSEFDVIITNFFFDLFDEVEGFEIAANLNNLMTEDGLWILTDFETSGKWWQKSLIILMYLFFNKTTGLKTKELMDCGKILEDHGLKPVAVAKFFGRFIISILYRKKPLFT